MLLLKSHMNKLKTKALPITICSLCFQNLYLASHNFKIHLWTRRAWERVVQQLLSGTDPVDQQAGRGTPS